MNPTFRKLALLFVLLFAGAALSNNAAAESAYAVTPTLPSPRDEASSVWMGGAMWTFGGRLPNGVTREIVRYVPGWNAADVPLNLPTARRCTAAVYTGTDAYVIGGSDANNVNLRSIVKVSTSTMTVGPDQNILPSGRNCPAAVWTGTEVYIFGGCCDSTGNYHNRIVRYVPSTNSVTTLALSGGQYGALAKCCTSAVWDPVLGKAYIFGGEGGAVSNQIVEWTKATNTVAVKSTTLPSARLFASSVWDSEQRVSYIFGGMGGAGGPTWHNSILRYVPATNALTTMTATLPTARGMTTAVWSGALAFIAGGSLTGGMTNEIVRYNPGNFGPSAEFTWTVSGAGATFDASASTDPDRDALTYSWSWGDGSPAGSGVSPTHTFPCAGPYDVRLTVSDGLGGGASRTQAVTVDPAAFPDGADGDGMPTCGEAGQGTTDTDADFDDDGLSDLVESAAYVQRKAVFCPTPTSLDPACAYPRPTLRDLYVEMDWYEGTQPSTATLDIVRNAFANSPLNPDIRIIIDSGQLGGGRSLGAGGSFGWATVLDVYGNSANFADARRDIFHYGLMACTDTVDGSGGTATTPGDVFVVYGCGTTDAWRGAAILHELGHNILGLRYDAAAGDPADPECQDFENRSNPALMLSNDFTHERGRVDCDADLSFDKWSHSVQTGDAMFGGNLLNQATYVAATWSAIRLDLSVGAAAPTCRAHVPTEHLGRVPEGRGPCGREGLATHADLPAAPAALAVASAGALPASPAHASILALLAAAVAVVGVAWLRRRAP